MLDGVGGGGGGAGVDGSDNAANQVFSSTGRGKGDELSLVLVTLQSIPS